MVAYRREDKGDSKLLNGSKVAIFLLCIIHLLITLLTPGYKHPPKYVIFIDVDSDSTFARIYSRPETILGTTSSEMSVLDEKFQCKSSQHSSFTEFTKYIEQQQQTTLQVNDFFDQCVDKAVEFVEGENAKHKSSRVPSLYFRVHGDSFRKLYRDFENMAKNALEKTGSYFQSKSKGHQANRREDVSQKPKVLFEYHPVKPERYFVSGTEDAKYKWIALNYMKKRFGKHISEGEADKDTLSVLQLSPFSAGVAHEVTLSRCSENDSDKKNLFFVHLFTQKKCVFAVSFDNVGTRYAQKAYVKNLMLDRTVPLEPKDTLIHPCFNIKQATSLGDYIDDERFSKMKLGSPSHMDIEMCTKGIQIELLQEECDTPSNPFLGYQSPETNTTWYLFDEYVKDAEVLSKTKSKKGADPLLHLGDEPSRSLGDLKSAAKAFCEGKISHEGPVSRRTMSECFDLMFENKLISKFSRVQEDRFVYAKQIDNRWNDEKEPVNWSLGFLLEESKNFGNDFMKDLSKEVDHLEGIDMPKGGFLKLKQN